jgi:hypothetical protein
MKGIECGNCGAPARVVHGTYELKQVGLKNVVLQGIEIVKCPKLVAQTLVLQRVCGSSFKFAPLHLPATVNDRPSD